MTQIPASSWLTPSQQVALAYSARGLREGASRQQMIDDLTQINRDEIARSNTPIFSANDIERFVDQYEIIRADALRKAETIGRPLGDDRFMAVAARITGRDGAPRKRGPKPSGTRAGTVVRSQPALI